MKAYSHGGDVYTVPVRLDFSVNIHPDGVPDDVREAVIRSADRWGQYPDEKLRALRAAFTAYAAKSGFPLKEDQILFGNGAAELLYLAARKYEWNKAAVVTPCFTEYRRALEAAGVYVTALRLPPEAPLLKEAAEAVCEFVRLKRPAALMFGNPVNPTGRAFLKEEVLKIADACAEQGTDLILDECFVWFTDEPERYTVVKEVFRDPGRFFHVLVINAFTKLFAIPGLRFGFGLSPDTERIREMEALRQPWPVSVPAEAAALCCVKRLMEGRKPAEPDTEKEETEDLKTDGGTAGAGLPTDLRAERAFLSDGLRRLGFTVIPSEVNFILFRAGEEDLRAACLERGVLIRSCADFEGLSPAWYRAAVRKHGENEALLKVLGEILTGKEQQGKEFHG